MVEADTKKADTDPELVFAIVRAIGTDSQHVTSKINSLLEDAQYCVEKIQLSDRFKHISLLTDTLKESPEDERYKTYMNAGDLLRSATGRPDAAAVLGIMAIEERRSNLLAAQNKKRGRAYILKSLMHPRELETLRRVYASQLFVVSVFAPRDSRVKRLAKKISESRGDAVETWLPTAEVLVNRDVGVARRDDEVAKKISSEYVIDVQKTFHKADLFISATAPDESTSAVARFVELIFGNPFHTPTREEFGMCVAHNAALRSSSLARGVGAAILTPDGDVVSLGSNEVPRFGGGQYWPGDDPDGRTFVLGHDPSDRIRRLMIADLLRRLHSDRLWAKSNDKADLDGLNRVLDNLDVDSTVTDILKSDTIGKASVLDVIEYGREVHAEMAALTDAAKRGTSVRNCVLYLSLIHI